MSSGGGSSAPTSQTVNQVTIPPELMPYAQRTLGTAENLVYNKPYETYGGQRFAGLNPLMMQGFQATGQQGVTPQMGEASGLASLAGRQAGQMGAYAPSQYQGMDVNYLGTQAPQLRQEQMAMPDLVSAGQVSAPSLQQFQMGPAERVGGPGGFERVTGPSGFERVNAPGVGTFQMGPAERVGAERFGGAQAAEYMSPYMENVVEQQKRSAIRDYSRQIPGLQAAGIRAGARGGTREAILQAEAQRNLQDQLGNIEATGRQGAFQQAQQQFGADRAAAMQAALANQQAGLTTGQQNLAAQQTAQQLGVQTGLQSQLANQAAAQQAAQMGMTAQQLNQAAGLQTGQMGLQAALANQQAGLTTGQQNLAALLGVQQLGTQTGLQAGLANQQAGLQAGLANQQARQQAEQQNLGARLGIQQLGVQTGMQSQLANQQAQLQAQQQGLQQRQFGAEFGERSRQFGANLGLQGLQQQLAAAGTLGQLGQSQFNQQQQAAQNQLQAGSQLQMQEQQRLQAAYEDFLARQRYPYSQLGFMSDLIRGTPTAGGIQTMYQAPPSLLGQAAGAGMGIAGLSQAFRGG